MEKYVHSCIKVTRSQFDCKWSARKEKFHNQLFASTFVQIDLQSLNSGILSFILHLIILHQSRKYRDLRNPYSLP